jgi:hypothetical protein
LSFLARSAVSTFSTSSSLSSFSSLPYLDIVPEGRVFLLGPGALLGVSVLLRSRSRSSGDSRGGRSRRLLVSDLLLLSVEHLHRFG